MTVRRIALETLIRIVEDGAYANLALKESAEGVRRDEVPFLYALVYNALEHRAYAEYVLSHFCKRQKRVVRSILLLASSELLFMATPAHAVIHESVELTKTVGKAKSAGLVNAVLRRIDRERDTLPPLPDEPIRRLSIRYGYPAFILADWIDAYGLDAAEQLAKTQPSALQVRAQHPYTTEALRNALPVPSIPGRLDSNCLYLEHGFAVASNELYRDGKLTVQNEGAMLICRALGEVKGKRILDACAAPGGKTAYLASLAENDADLVAWELHPHRLELMQKTLDRLHVSATVLCRDASIVHEDAEDNFDAVLLDVPCSGFGLLADKPDLRYRKTDEDLHELVLVQKRILSACSRYVKCGGRLVYATCTISRRENEAQVRSFLREHTSFRLTEERQFLPHRDGIDGFYYAAMTRTEDE